MDSLVNRSLRAQPDLSLYDASTNISVLNETKLQNTLCEHTRLSVIHSNVQSPRKSPKRRQCNRFIPSRVGQGPVDFKSSTASPSLDPSHLLRFSEAQSSPIKKDLRSNYVKQTVTSSKCREIKFDSGNLLDLPGLTDDFYSNVTDWSKSDLVGIGLELENDSVLYVWDVARKEAKEVGTVSANAICSVKFVRDTYLCAGTSDGTVEIWDVDHQKCLKTLRGSKERVLSLSATENILSCGRSNGEIWHYDLRTPSIEYTYRLHGHNGSVCGLNWRSDGAKLASGGADCKVNIWDSRSLAPMFTKTQHKAAVKAFAWSPTEASVLATGGGNDDCAIHIWNTNVGNRISGVTTCSQIRSIHWNSSGRELATTHGGNSPAICVWSYPILSPLVKHGSPGCRFLYAALGPDQKTLMTCCEEERMNFWELFPDQPRSRLLNEFMLR